MRFGSNRIEKVGTDRDLTIKLCDTIFQGDNVSAEARSEQYEDRLKASIGSTEPGTSVKVRRRQEVVQHAKALRNITTALITDNEPLMEDHLLTTQKSCAKGCRLKTVDHKFHTQVYTAPKWSPLDSATSHIRPLSLYIWLG